MRVYISFKIMTSMPVIPFIPTSLVRKTSQPAERAVEICRASAKVKFMNGAKLGSFGGDGLINGYKDSIYTINNQIKKVILQLSHSQAIGMDETFS